MAAFFISLLKSPLKIIHTCYNKDKETIVESAQKRKIVRKDFVVSYISTFLSSILLMSEGKTPTDHFFFVPSCDKRGDSNGPGNNN